MFATWNLLSSIFNVIKSLCSLSSKDNSAKNQSYTSQEPFNAIEICIFIALCSVCYLLYTISEKIKENKTDQKAPPVYNNNNMNIAVWLNQMEEYLDVKKMHSDKQKQQTILEHLDKTSRSTIQALINDKTIRTYKDLSNHITNFFSNNTESTADYIIQFVDRKQQPTESLHQYYSAITDLAYKAYPSTPKTTVDQFIAKQFMQGLYNSLVKSQLLINQDKDTKANVLSKALAIHSKLGDSVNDLNHPSFNVNHVQTSHNRHNTDIQSNNNHNNNNYSPLNNYNRNNRYNQPFNSNNDQKYSKPSNQQFYDRNEQNYQRRDQQTSINQRTQIEKPQPNNFICYNCNKSGHTSQSCPEPKQNINQRHIQQPRPNSPIDERQIDYNETNRKNFRSNDQINSTQAGNDRQ